MKIIIFKIHICGMSNRNISRKIMIYKPFKTITKFLCFNRCLQDHIPTAEDLISYIKKSTNNLSCYLGECGLDNFNVDNLYIKHRGYLIGLQHNKDLADIFNFFQKNIIEFKYIYVAGGASCEHHGYKFIVHSNEDIHKNTPHVHVERNGVAPRYLLDTLERIPSDEYSHEHLRDEKKIIKPYIRRNIKWFNEKWLMSVNGYIPPIESETGVQYCKES